MRCVVEQRGGGRTDLQADHRADRHAGSAPPISAGATAAQTGAMLAPKIFNKTCYFRTESDLIYLISMEVVANRDGDHKAARRDRHKNLNQEYR